jgi:hypothetical protein
MASTGTAGLVVKMIHRACRTCGGVDFVIGSSCNMHHASLRCVQCNQHAGWLSRGAYVFIQMTVSKFGRPTEPITVRHPYDEGL